MKYFIAFCLIYFCYSIVFAAEDSCQVSCSADCRGQVNRALEEIESHQNVCNGRRPTYFDSECALTCSPGCKAVMRGQLQIAQNFLAFCGGGNGYWGQLECAQENGQFFPTNNQTLRSIGDGYAFPGLCEEAIATLNSRVFCTLRDHRYAIHSVTRDVLGWGTSFISECKELIENIKAEKICVLDRAGGYVAYSLLDYQLIDGKKHKFLWECTDSL